MLIPYSGIIVVGSYWSLNFNVEVDADSSVGLALEVFGCRFIRGEAVFCPI